MRLEIPTNAQVKDVLEVMREHVGRATAISRAALMIELGFRDRTIRACLQKISEAGDVAIVHRAKTGGYYVADHWRQVTRELVQLRSRQASLTRRIRGLEHAAGFLRAEETGEAQLPLAPGDVTLIADGSKRRRHS